MQHAFQVVHAPIYQATKLVRNDLYWRFIKRFPSVVRGATRHIDACHTVSHGLSRKSSDMRCIPLSRKCHGQCDSGLKGLELLHHLSLAALVQKINHLWERKPRRPL